MNLSFVQVVIERQSHLEKEVKGPNWIDLFRTPKMRKRMILTILTW